MGRLASGIRVCPTVFADAPLFNPTDLDTNETTWCPCLFGCWIRHLVDTDPIRRSTRKAEENEVYTNVRKELRCTLNSMSSLQHRSSKNMSRTTSLGGISVQCPIMLPLPDRDAWLAWHRRADVAHQSIIDTHNAVTSVQTVLGHGHRVLPLLDVIA